MDDPITPDPRDRRDDGLQDARDNSDPGPDSDYEAFAAEETARMWHEIEPDSHAYHSRFDTREEWEDSR